MNDRVFFAAPRSGALEFAAKELQLRGMTIADTPTDAVTHLLLGVPCCTPDGELDILLKKLSPEVKIFGGNLTHPGVRQHPFRDLLRDERYLAQNAKITAYCAMNIAAGRMGVIWDGCPVLVVGWGRIGKCLARLLQAMGAEVTVAARREEQRAVIAALGYTAEDPKMPGYMLCRYRVIFNTVPSPVLSAQMLEHCRPGCLKIELASAPGMEGDDIIPARRLPGIYAPESSGKLIARTVLRMCAEREVGI
ncbi:MAG: hypothetical protein IJ351_00640 [Oscillospiraceae bacterium]|nr:hypothetical protein [Oscillospiraceae bacterium]